eukprot:jgi/Chlat1/5447/Chrsp36S05450
MAAAAVVAASPATWRALSASSSSTATHLLLHGSFRLNALPSLSLRSSTTSRRLKAAASASAGVQADRKPSEAGPPSQPKAAPFDVNPPRGTRDFPPEDMRLRMWLFGHFREVSRLFGFEEYDSPVLESEELFTRKAGEEIVTQLYNFEDKGGRRMALRPELTPSLARIVLQKGQGLPPPVKWFAIGQCWRYERMTRGRRREHYQWNMDVIGVPGVEAEAELLAAITTFFTRVGLSSQDIGIRVSNRKVLQAVLDNFNIPPESFAAVCVIVDKIEKLPREQVQAELAQLAVPADAIDGILNAMSLRTLEDLEGLLGAESLAVAELKQLFALAEGYGFRDWLQFDASVVRGLAYYTGTVFEAFDRKAELRAICGGGRYDKLLATYGGGDTPACGFGFGDAVIVELLKDKGLLPMLPPAVDDLLVTLDSTLRKEAAGIASRLRAAGRTVDFVLEDKRLKWVFKYADRCGASRLIMVGKDEWEKGVVKVKVLATREETEMAVSELC